METNVTELSDSRVKVEVEVPPDEVEARVQQTATRLGGEMKIPGFRKGKVPPEMVAQRVGREAVLTEALESSLADWYERALLDAAITPVGNPKLDMSELPGEAEPLRFAIEVAVRPKAKLGDYKGLEVGRAETEVPADAIQGELERLREGFAKLNPVDRAGADGDVLLIDYVGEIEGEGFEGGEAKDYLLELGSGRVLPELEKALAGAKAGDEKTATVEFPDDYQGEEVAGKTAEFKVKVREVREKELPELDDDFAAEASEFDTLDELRAHIGERMREFLEQQTTERFQESALDAAVAASDVDIPDEIVLARAEEMWQRVERRMREQGMEPDQYLQMQDKSRDELIAEAKPDASRALKREAVLEAVADAEKIEITEEDMLEALQVPPGHEDHGHPEPAEALAELRKSGRDGLLRQDLRMRSALEAIASESTPIPLEQAEAREQIWTPEKEREEKGRLWRPGDPTD